MSDNDAPLDLYLAVYGDADSAQADYDGLKNLVDAGTIKIEAMVLVSRDADGSIDVKDSDHSGRKGAGIGAGVGLVVGALFPPALIGSAVAGGLIGGGAGSLKSHHTKNEIKADLENDMPPDSSGIVVVFSEIWVDQIKKGLAKASKVDEEKLDDASKKAVEDANAS